MLIRQSQINQSLTFALQCFRLLPEVRLAALELVIGWIITGGRRLDPWS